MRGAIAAGALGLVVCSGQASAQVANQPEPVAPPADGISPQASYNVPLLLASYMSRLAAAGAPVSQEDIEEAAHQYMTNGAAATSVPTSGPAAAYFTNGAAVTGVPASGPVADYFRNGAQVFAYSPEPVAATSLETPSADAGLPRPKAAQEVPASQTEVAQNSVPAPAAPTTMAATIQPAVNSATGLTCSPQEIEAAMAIARVYAGPSTPAPVPTSAALAAAAAPEPSFEELRSSDVPRAPARSRRPSPWWPIVSALVGALLGAASMSLWTRVRVRHAGHGA